MPRVSLAFFTVAALCGLTGMIWGTYMGATQTFTLSPAHAHLNLLGWVTLAIMGGFYVLAGPRASSKLAWVNFAMSASGAILLTVLLSRLLLGDTSVVPLMAVAEVLVIGGMLTFIASIVRTWRRPAGA